MRAVMVDVPESLLDERRRLGLDLFDEMWQGVLHMVPPPSGHHQRLGSEMLAVLLGAAKRRGLVASHETGLFVAADDYRVPDLIISLPDNCSDRGVDGTARFVAELLSPNDESYDKLAWYAEHGVDEILVVDPIPRTVELYRSVDGRAVAVEPAADGALSLETLDVRFATVSTADGPRLWIESGGVSTDC